MLFSKIPVNKVINSIFGRLFNTCDKYQGFTKKQFRQMSNLRAEDNIFVFEDKFYHEIDGAPIGRCVSPSLADLFWSCYEEKWLDDNPKEFKPVLYRRYVVDCFLLFKSESKAAPFLQYLNSQHLSIKLTYNWNITINVFFLT